MCAQTPEIKQVTDVDLRVPERPETPVKPGHLSPSHPPLGQGRDPGVKLDEMTIARPMQSVTQRQVPEHRKLVLDPAELGMDKKRGIHHRNTPQKSTGQSSSQRNVAAQSFGLFKRPYYPYEGGPFMRVLIFLANLWKLLEKLIVAPANVQSPGTIVQIPPPEPITVTLKKKRKQESDNLAPSMD